MSGVVDDELALAVVKAAAWANLGAWLVLSITTGPMLIMSQAGGRRPILRTVLILAVLGALQAVALWDFAISIPADRAADFGPRAWADLLIHPAASFAIAAVLGVRLWLIALRD